jgi:hypothetical protein
LASLMTARKWAWTLEGSASPSEKNTTVLRPGMSRIELTTAIRPFEVEYPCWSRSIDSKLCDMRYSICWNWLVTAAAPESAPAAPAAAPPAAPPGVGTAGAPASVWRRRSRWRARFDA